jgi:undecaprenyl-diphosphatase
MILLDAQQSGIFNYLMEFDQWLFLQINTVWTNASLDVVFPVWRESLTWVPLYVFLLAFAFYNFGNKIWFWILILICTVIVTDQISSGFFKDFFGRLRPCRDPEVMNQMRLLLNRCPVSFSFTSSHATNHFGVAVFIILTMKPIMKHWRWLFIVWAATISYGQVYVGVHYPLDVIGGAFVGSSIGWLTAMYYNKKFGLPPMITEA